MKTSYIGVYEGIATNPAGKSMSCWSVYLHIRPAPPCGLRTGSTIKLLRLFFYRTAREKKQARADAEKFARRSRSARGLPQPQEGE